MPYINFVLVLVFSSSFWVISAEAAEDEYFGMVPIPIADFRRPLNPLGDIVISNMPAHRSQDSLGLCYSFVSSTLIDKQTCSDSGEENCDKIDDSMRTSPLDIARFNNKLPAEAEREKYVGLNENGSLTLTLRNALKNGAVASESCAPYFQIVANNTDPEKRREIEAAFWKRLKDMHAQYTQRTRGCATCDAEALTAVDDFKQDFSIKASSQEILSAFSQDTFAAFLDKLLIPEKCRQVEGMATFNSNYDVAVFPEKPLKSGTPQEKKQAYDSMIAQIKKVLAEKKVPLGLSFCSQPGNLTFKSMKDCTASPNGSTSGAVAGAGHSVVVKGYRRICKTQDKDDCYDAVQLQNSWGADWQSDTGGWVDAKELMKRTFYSTASLTWLEPKPTN